MTSSSAAAAAREDAPDPRRWAALTVLLVGSFLAPLDFFIVNVAMPAISTGLNASPSQVQLVISGYAVVYAALLITGGRLGDLFGRKSVFLVGLAGFAGASALCGLAWSPDSLILGRLVQAIAAAAVAPQALACVHALFPAHERGRALSIYGVTLGLSSIVGQLLGGVLVSANLGGYGWRLIFLINLPIALAAFIAALPLLRETRAGRRPRLDVVGVVLSALALTALVLPLVEGRERGWPWWSFALLAMAPLLGEAFRRYEIRLAEAGGEPLVAIDIFRAPGLARGLGALVTLYALAAFFLTFAFYLQQGLHRGAFEAGLAILPFSVGFLIGSSGSPMVARLAGAAAPVVGFACSASGLVVLATAVALSPTDPSALAIALALLPMGFGMGMSVPTMARAIVERVEPQRAGLVGGLVNSTLQVSAALGVAALGGVFYTVLGGREDPQSIAQAFSVTMLSVAACHALGGWLASGLAAPRPAPLPAASPTA